jgi:transposase
VYRVTPPWEWRVSFDNVVWVGADENEMNWRIGHNYLTVFPDLTAKRLLFATPGKDASVWQAFAAELLRHNGHPKALHDVAIDMSAAHVRGVSDNFGNGRVVYDKCYVIQNVVEACDQVQKAENRVNWTDKETQKWDLTAPERCMTSIAYEMRLVFQGIYERKNAKQATKLYRNWCAWVQEVPEQTGVLLEPMARTARMVEENLEVILAHWTRGLTTAFM